VIDTNIIYESIRHEIVDQKKCQFQLFSTALTLTAAILAYGASTKVGPLVYVAPIIMNTLALNIILEKATSIQRMVGYLQIMEQTESDAHWMWEYHLRHFRECPGKSCGSETHRKHAYVRNVALMLLMLNAVSSGLYFWGPEAITLRASKDFASVSQFYGGVHVIVIALNFVGIFVAGRRLFQLIFGQFTAKAIQERWATVIEQEKKAKTFQKAL